jgi:hypothetical protein
MLTAAQRMPETSGVKASFGSVPEGFDVYPREGNGKKSSSRTLCMGLGSVMGMMVEQSYSRSSQFYRRKETTQREVSLRGQL